MLGSLIASCNACLHTVVSHACWLVNALSLARSSLAGLLTQNTRRVAGELTRILAGETQAKIPLRRSESSRIFCQQANERKMIVLLDASTLHAEKNKSGDDRR